MRATYTESSIRSYDTLEQMTHTLFLGEVDVIMMDMLCAVSWLKTREGMNFDFAAALLSVEDPLNDAYGAVRKGETDLVHAINVAIPDLKSSGVYDKINRKYFSFSVY